MSGPLERLIELAHELSGLDVADLDPATPLVQLGFDSLVLTQLAQRLRKSFGVDISFRDFFQTLPTLEAIEAHVVGHGSVRSSGPAAGGGGDDPAGPSFPDTRAEEPGDLSGVMIAQLQVMSRQLDLIVGGAPARAAGPRRVPEEDPPRDGTRVGSRGGPAAASTGRAKPSSGPPGGITPHQERFLRCLAEEWSARTPRSKELVDRQRPAHADPRTAAGFDLRWKELVYPLVIERSSGPWLWDVDGNRYLDLLNGFGPTFFGHAPEFISAALRAQIDRGFEIGPQTPLAGEAAALVCELTGLDRASFVCTGSEAVQAAIRAARTYTGRDRIVVFSRDYHGNFDEVLVHGVEVHGRPRTFPSAPGIPQRAVDDVIVLEYGSDRALEEIRSSAGELAAVIVEPVQTRQPDLQPVEFLRALREITREAGALLVLDEIVTGFRCHPGGAQAVFGIEADLCTYGKVVGGGMPIGVVAGRRPYIDVFDGGPWQFGDDSQPTEGRTFFAGTFVRHPLAIAAAHEVLTRFRREGPGLQERVNARTSELAARLNGVAVALGLPIEVPHFASIMYFRVTDAFGGLSSLFFHMMREQGVYLLEGFPSYLTTVHEKEHVDAVVAAFEASGRRMQEANFWPPPTGQVPVSDPEPDLFGAPPIPGARLGRAPDGSPAWYVEDPESPGSYTRVD